MKSKDNNYELNKWVKCGDKLTNVNKSLVMGVLNVTPDSFFSGSRNADFEAAKNHIESIVNAGVDIIDVGGVSTRPGAHLLTEKEELDRVLPIVQFLKTSYPEISVSVDTFRAGVAEKVILEGADMINDVYAGAYDQNMFSVIAKYDVPYIIMHARGDAQTMQDLCHYEDVVKEVVQELSVKVDKLRRMGVKDVIVDPGFGFAKNLEQNYELFKGCSYFKVLDCPLLIGISRKSMIYKLLNLTPNDSLNGTTVLNSLSIFEQNAIIRVHDVAEAIQARKIIEAIKFGVHGFRK